VLLLLLSGKNTKSCNNVFLIFDFRLLVVLYPNFFETKGKKDAHPEPKDFYVFDFVF
jgi:hypothetical protein